MNVNNNIKNGFLKGLLAKETLERKWNIKLKICFIRHPILCLGRYSESNIPVPRNTFITIAKIIIISV